MSATSMVTAEVPERQAHLDVTKPRSRMHVQSPDACVRAGSGRRTCAGILVDAVEMRFVPEARPLQFRRPPRSARVQIGDLSSADDMRDAAIEEFIEERRQQALAMIAKMREPDDA